jgi:hypothetical protein
VLAALAPLPVKPKLAPAMAAPSPLSSARRLLFGVENFEVPSNMASSFSDQISIDLVWYEWAAILFEKY